MSKLFERSQRKSTKARKARYSCHPLRLMTAAEVDSVIVEQTHQDKKFGELTIEMGYTDRRAR